MSEKQRPHYADPKGIITTGFDFNGIICEGDTVPTDGTAGYAPGAIFFKRAGTVGAQRYINQGTVASCAFVAEQSAAVKTVGGVATITGSGDVATGLATVAAVTATLQADASLTNGIAVTATIGNQSGVPAAGSVTIKVWKPTASGDVTPIASAAAVAVNWVAVGT